MVVDSNTEMERRVASTEEIFRSAEIDRDAAVERERGLEVRRTSSPMRVRWMTHDWCLITGCTRLCARIARCWRRTGGGVRPAVICISKFTTKIKSNHGYLLCTNRTVLTESLK
jgi:hypothetical protein